MLDKIEVGSKWICRDRPSVIATVNAVGTCRLLFNRSDYPTIEYAHDITRFTEDYEPSPESPVDDVIWEEGFYRVVVNNGKYWPEYSTRESGDFRKDTSLAAGYYSTGIFNLWNRAEKAEAELARLSPPTTTVEEWPRIGGPYWLADPTANDFAYQCQWNESVVDLRWKERGLIFKTEEEAVTVGQAMAEAAKKMVEGVGK